MQNEKESFLESTRFLSILISCIIILTSIYYFIIYQLIGESEKRGHFGDTFGALNTVFTGLAFAVVIYGIILQRREIKLQQRELADTRDVFKQQSFENSFFNLQTLLNETIASIEWKARRESIAQGQFLEKLTGRVALAQMADDVFAQYIQKLNRYESANSSSPTEQEQVNWVLEEYSDFYNSNESLLGNYFRLVYNVLKFISTSEFTALEKEQYAHFFRAQLSEGELVLIVLNALTNRGQKMKKYLEEFAMLKHATMEGRGTVRPNLYFHSNAFVDIGDRR